MFFLGGLHGLPHPQRQINGLQRCNSLLCGCQILQGKAVHRLIGRQHGFAAAQAVELLHVQADGVGVVLLNAMAGAVCAAAD